MKNIGIVTINDNNNYGNRLQNYALQEYLKKMNFEVVTLKNNSETNTKDKILFRYLKNKISNINKKDDNIKRKECFDEFNKNISFSSKTITPYSKIDKCYNFFISGSDQVWNPNFGRMRDVDFLSFASNKKKISYAASFGVEKISLECEKKLKEELIKFKSISVREDAGKSIIERAITRNDINVVIDPTMLLTTHEWNKILKKPLQLNSKRYILNYFLGQLSEERKNEIERIAKENNCEIINILDKKSPFYQTGPSEFVYLEKNAFLICTDSFHSCVFAFLYDKPFIVFNRESKSKSMNSRIETLIDKFNLKNRRFEGKITKENLNHDYTEAYKILKEERKKSEKFLRKALDLD